MVAAAAPEAVADVAMSEAERRRMCQWRRARVEVEEVGVGGGVGGGVSGSTGSSIRPVTGGGRAGRSGGIHTINVSSMERDPLVFRAAATTHHSMREHAHHPQVTNQL